MQHGRHHSREVGTVLYAHTDIDELRKKILDQKENRNVAMVPITSASAVGQKSSVERLQDLKSMLENELISAEEYAQKKAEIIATM